MTQPNQHQQAIDYLLHIQPQFSPVIKQFGVYELTADEDSDLFQALSRTIIYQQLAGKAAASIHQKFKRLYHEETPSAKQTTQKNIDDLRSAGLSNAKAKAVMHLAECVNDGSLPDTKRLKSMSDVEVLNSLLIVKGVGPWTANIAMMFWLGRPDVFPANDLGLKKGIQKLFKLSELPNEHQTATYAVNWQPYRTYASWYLWRLLEV